MDLAAWDRCLTLYVLDKAADEGWGYVNGTDRFVIVVNFFDFVEITPVSGDVVDVSEGLLRSACIAENDRIEVQHDGESVRVVVLGLTDQGRQLVSTLRGGA